ncbi:hypothetical protein [Cupriavidus basilensis]|uniref:hypothetical protein n=1 Tax=Cupriavidus basilensis TaxID=68895 RepID=UPI0039F742A9
MNSPAIRKVTSLAEYRAKKEPEPPVPTIEIRLLPNGLIEYQTVDLEDRHEFQALIGCYAVMGELLETLRDKFEGEA